MLDFADRPIVFVGGKGGVGKTTTASALALASARSGKRTLLVSTDPAHNLGDLFDRKIGDTAKSIVPQLDALEIDPDDEVDRYLESVRSNLRELVRPEMYKDVDSQIELTRMAPGAQEAALLERLSRILLEDAEAYDRVVFDTAPTGSTLRLLSLPEVMTAWMEGLLARRERAESFRESLKGSFSDRDPRENTGETSETSKKGRRHEEEDPRAARIRRILEGRRNRFSKARRILRDPARCAFLLVVIPEKLAILEGYRAHRSLTEAGIPVTGVIVNRVLPEGPIGDFLESRRVQEQAYLQEIDDKFRRVPRLRVPLMEEDVGNLEGLAAVASLLALDQRTR